MFVSLLIGMLGIAIAEESVNPEEKDIFTTVDDAFGKYFVGPLASVMFWDVMFWDNSLSLGEGVGMVIDNQYVASYDKSYTLLPQFTAPQENIQIRLTEPVANKNDFFTWTIHQQADRTLTATIPATTIPVLEVEMIPVAEWEGALPEVPQVEVGNERFVTEALTEKGVPVIIDRKIAGKEETEPLPPYKVLGSTSPVSLEKFPIENGTSVWVEQAKEGSSEWQEATFVSLQTSTTTRFNKVTPLTMKITYSATFAA